MIVTPGDEALDKQHVKGAADKVAGSIRDTVGQATGNTRELEGKADKTETGAPHSAPSRTFSVGDASRRNAELPA